MTPPSVLQPEELYDLKLEEGLSPRTVNYIRVAMSKALRYELSKNLLRKSVAFFAEAPSPTARRPGRSTLRRPRYS